MSHTSHFVIKCLQAVALLALGIGNSDAASDVSQTFTSPVEHVQRDELSISGLAFVKFELERHDAPPLRFFVSRTTRPAPLLLYIQGSGCTPVFIKMNGQPASTVYSLLPTAGEGRYAVMVVDKPLVPESPTASAGTAIDCPKAFNEYFSYSSWGRDLRQAYDMALALPWVDSRRTLVLGMSEGAVMAAGLAGSDSRVTDVAMLGATGPSQFFDFIAAAYRSNGSDSEVLSKIQEFEATTRAISADPESATKFAWGHPYKRWSGFLSASSDRSLMPSRARVYLVSGMSDASVPILSTEALYSDLRATGKNVTMRRIPGASHSLQPALANDYEQLGTEIARVFQWFDKQ